MKLTNADLRKLLELSKKGKSITATEVLRFQELSSNLARPLAEEVLRLRRLARLALDEVTGPGGSDITERDIQELREALRDAD